MNKNFTLTIPLTRQQAEDLKEQIDKSLNEEEPKQETTTIPIDTTTTQPQPDTNSPITICQTN